MQAPQHGLKKMWGGQIMVLKAAKDHESALRCFGKNQASAGNPPTSHNIGRSQKDPPKNTYRILLAEDDSELRALLTHSFQRDGFQVVACPDGWDLIEHLEHQLFPGDMPEHIDIIVSDIRMPGATGIEVLRDLGDIEDFPPMILITAFGNDKTHWLAGKLGAAAIFDKPFDIDALLAKVHEILNV